MAQKVVFTFLEHLEELRRRLLVSLGAVLIGALSGYFFSDRALSFFLKPLQDEIGQAYFFSPAEGFLVKIKVALFLGILAASPVVLSQGWLFVAPALHLKEKKIFLPLVGITSVFFLAGSLFCFFFVVPPALHFLLGVRSVDLTPMISASEYVSFLSGMMLAFGVAFNLPVVILGLVQAGFLKSNTLNQFQKHAIVLIFIAAAVLTPGPDLASQLLLAAPLLILFEISVLLAKVLEGRRKK